MFIYSMRAGTLKFFGILALAAVTLAVLMIFVPTYGVAAAGNVSETVSYAGIRTNDDRVAFIRGAGLTVSETPLEQVDFTVPEEFDRVLSGYNEIQKQQGLDLSRYAKKTVTRYTYTAQDYPDYDGTVYVNLILYRDRVVAADVCSADPNGFVRPLLAV